MKTKKQKLFAIASLGLLANIGISQTTLVSSGSSWKYLDNGTNQGTAWYGSSFNDAAWAAGNSQLGYGDGDEATVVSYGSNSNNKYITTYFRKEISVPTATAYTSYSLSVKRDDGIVLYVNGVEKYRNNMPTGTPAYNTLATNASDDGGTWQVATLAAGTFTNGNNVIAVEIHQTAVTSSDISFDMQLIGLGSGGGGTAALTRGPYLQMGTSSSVILRWRSDVATNTKVSYGLTAGSLTSSVTNTTSVTDHEIQITGLTPNTKYYYNIGSTTQVLQGDANNFFTTAPVIGTEQKVRVWVTGDCGNNSTNQVNVRNQYQTYIGSNNTDVWLLLGDNAYNGGLDNEYQSNFYNIYKDKMLKQSVLWPAPGNHDYDNNATNQNTHNIPYYTMFSLPTSAQVGGVASGTEAFYSYNYANVHFIALDSYGKESSQYRLYDTLGPQAVWLKQDLAANTQKWTIVYFHHPPYTMGSHNSDTESELVSMRTNLIRILERYKVDLILCGHSHTYERSKLMKGHYGLESTFNAGTHNLSTSSAKYDGSASSCPYVKNSPANNNGSVYVVAGSAGQLGGTQTSFPHNAMYYSDATNGGSLALDIEANRLDAKWICADGVVRDKFTIEKDVNKVTNINLTSGQSATLTASWIGNYSWNTGATSRSVSVSPTSTTSYTVTDGMTCLSDVFNVTVTAGKLIRIEHHTELDENLSLKIYPNPFSKQTTIEYSTPYVGQVILEVYNIEGKKVKSLLSQTQDNGVYKHDLNAKEEGLEPGFYFITLTFGEHQVSQKVLLEN